ncbi:hypothetical protein Tco_1432379 [Tanacetum coccineum]
MANLELCDKHNMVAYLKKPTGSEGSQEIVDFLNGSHIRFSLTKNPTIYVSLIKMFWQIATDDKVERATTTAASLDASQASGNITKTQSMAIRNVPFPQGIGAGGSPRCQEATGGSIAQTRSERVPIQPHDSPIPRVNTLGSDEGSMQLQELMALCIKLLDSVLALETDLRMTKQGNFTQRTPQAKKQSDQASRQVSKQASGSTNTPYDLVFPATGPSLGTTQPTATITSTEDLQRAAFTTPPQTAP